MIKKNINLKMNNCFLINYVHQIIHSKHLVMEDNQKHIIKKDEPGYECFIAEMLTFKCNELINDLEFHHRFLSNVAIMSLI